MITSRLWQSLNLTSIDKLNLHSCAIAVVAAFIERVEALELQLNVPANRLLQLKSEGKTVETVAAKIVAAGDFQDQVAALIVPKCLVTDRATNNAIGCKRVEFRSV